MKIGELINRLFDSVERVGDCWIWKGSKFTDGYGRIHVDGKPRRLHRLIFEMATREKIPTGLLVCHTCDTPLCCNPDHLFLGTPSDNHHDAMRKGRHTKGEKVNTCKLTEQQVLEIRRRWEQSPKKYGLYSKMAREFGVSNSNIHFIISRRSWKHI